MTDAVRPAALEPLPDVYTAIGACHQRDEMKVSISIKIVTSVNFNDLHYQKELSSTSLCRH